MTKQLDVRWVIRQTVRLKKRFMDARVPPADAQATEAVQPGDAVSDDSAEGAPAGAVRLSAYGRSQVGRDRFLPCPGTPVGPKST
jgi:hypothetical protein